MPMTREELDQFHQYAIEQISRNDAPLELDELVTNWQELRERLEVKAILDGTLADVDAGNFGRDAFEVTDELARKHGLMKP